jgi:hypothetical protein
VKHVVPSSVGLGKVLVPFGQSAHPLGHNCDHGDAIERDIDTLAGLDEPSLSRHSKGGGVQHRGALVSGEDGIDVEVSFASFDATIWAIVFKPVDECTSVGDGQVNLDGLGKVGGKPKGEIRMVLPKGKHCLLALNKVVAIKLASIERKVGHKDTVTRGRTSCIDSDT